MEQAGRGQGHPSEELDRREQTVRNQGYPNRSGDLGQNGASCQKPMVPQKLS